jgi:hypothetical protein
MSQGVTPRHVEYHTGRKEARGERASFARVVVAALLIAGCSGVPPGAGPGAPSETTVAPSAGVAATPMPRPTTTRRPTPTPGPFTVPSRIQVGGGAFGMAFGFDSLWVYAGDGVYRVDPGSQSVIATVPLPDDLPAGAGLIPSFLATGEDAVWVAVAGPRLFLVRIDPESNEATATIELGPAPERPTALAADADSVWVTNFAASTLTRVDARDDSIVATIETREGGGGSPSGVVVVGGSVWVANHHAGEVVRVDPVANEVVERIPVGFSVGRLATDGDAVWVTNFEGRLARIDVETAEVTSMEGCPTGHVGAFGGGFLWMSLERGMCRIDPQTGEVVLSFMPHDTAGLVYADDSPWLSFPGAGAIGRVHVTE